MRKAMNVLIEVLMIAVGTALLAALIVVADWDLVVIRRWEGVRDRWLGAGRPVSSGPSEAPAESSDSPPMTAGDAWLASMAAHRLADYRRDQPDERPATPLLEVLAARRNGHAA